MLVVLTAGLAAAQDAESEIRRVLMDYREAVRSGRGEDAFFGSGYRFFGAYGHIFERAIPGDRTAARGRRRSDFVVSVHFVSEGVASAAGIWRDAGARPPFDAGMFDATLVREQGLWKIANSRDGYLPSPDLFFSSGPGAPLGADWETLFDGKTGAGWMAVNGLPGLPETWRIDDGSLVTVKSGLPMSIRTVRQFETFEMEWEWKVAAGANSGVKYRLYSVRVSPDGGVGDGVGFEYQLADDTGDVGAVADPRQRSGTLYGVTAPPAKLTRAVGEWNQSRIVAAKDHVEHWLNGVETARYPVDAVFPSPISLQHHTSEVRFRNLRIRALPSVQ